MVSMHGHLEEESNVKTQVPVITSFNTSLASESSGLNSSIA